jgi:hypothetical protein
MTDITDRLRLEYAKADDTDTEQTVWDAKDEIERLRAELEKKRDLLGKAHALAMIRLARVADLEATLERVRETSIDLREADERHLRAARKEAADAREELWKAMSKREAVAEVPLSSLVCVGRAKFPRTGGNAGISWYVEDALADTGGFRSGNPCNGELLFVLPTTAKRAMLAAKGEGQ